MDTYANGSVGGGLGLAALGRNGDSTLVHMNPQEVAGLQSLAQANGTSLTVNPQTGLPEAFSLGGIFKNLFKPETLLPMIAGAVAAPMTGGTSLGLALGQTGTSLAAGALTGAALAGAKGDNILTGALTGGLGGWGGGNLMNSALGNVANPATNLATEAAQSGVESGVGALSDPNITNGIWDGAGTLPTIESAKTAGFIDGVPTGATPTFNSLGDAFSQAGQNIAADPMKFVSDNKMALAAPVLGGFMSSFDPETQAMMSEEERKKKELEDARRPLNLNSGKPLNLSTTMYAASGGQVPRYAMGGITNGGIADIYSTPDGSSQRVSRSEYGIGRLDALANQAAMDRASYQGFAGGGKAEAERYNPKDKRDAREYAMLEEVYGDTAMPSYFAERLKKARSPIERAFFFDKLMQGRVSPPDVGGNASARIDAIRNMDRGNTIMADQRNMSGQSIAPWMGGNHSASETEYARGGHLEEGGFVVPADVVSHLGNGSSDAGLKHLIRKYGAKPIKGKGDGMSDDIPTTIEGKHPARVANDEAYISRDVVKAHGGSKKFYAMMDKVRKARTGTTKQGKKINPDKLA